MIEAPLEYRRGFLSELPMLMRIVADFGKKSYHAANIY